MLPFRTFILGAALLVLLALSLPLVAGFLGRLHPAFDSFAHFRVHLAAAMAIAALPLLVSTWWKHGALAIVLAAAAVLTATGLPAVGPVQAAVEKDDGRKTYRLVHLNLRFNHTEPQRVLTMLRDLSPDIVTLAEVSDMWRIELRKIATEYPFRLICDGRRWSGGVAILSRQPFIEPARGCFAEGTLAIASVSLDGSAVDVAAMHLYWPWPYEQPDQIDRMRPVLAKLGQTAILAGDLNAAPWSQAARGVASAGALTPIASVGPTWLTWRLPGSLRPLIGLPIDQAFAKGDILVRSAGTLDEVGSDHLPVQVEFSIAGGSEPATIATASLDFPRLDLN